MKARKTKNGITTYPVLPSTWNGKKGHIVNFKSIGVMKQKKFVLDQLFNDLENHSRVHPKQVKDKVNNARVCLEELHIDLLKGMLNNGFFTK